MTGNTEVSTNGDVMYEGVCVGTVTADDRDYVEITKEQFEAFLTTLPAPVKEIDATEYYAEYTQERAYLAPVNSVIGILVLPTVDRRDDTSRAYATDAMRINLIHMESGFTLESAPHTKRRQNWAVHFRRKFMDFWNNAPDHVRSCPECGGFVVRFKRDKNLRKRLSDGDYTDVPKYGPRCINWHEDFRPDGVDKCEHIGWEW